MSLRKHIYLFIGFIGVAILTGWQLADENWWILPPAILYFIMYVELRIKDFEDEWRR